MNLAIWTICGLATAGVIARPFKWPEAVWALGGAAMLLITGLLPWRDAAQAVGKGSDVYLFLTGMMLLAETARREGLFDWAAAYAVAHANGSPRRLSALIYGVGVVITVFLSNDATAVVLTPAVYAATRKAKVDPLPYLFACALIANAASFVLPISNPANLVLYGGHTPPLGRWLASFGLPALLAIGATYAILLRVERDRLRGRCASPADLPALTTGGRAALSGIALAAVTLTVVCAFDIRLGLPTCLLGLATAATVLMRNRESPVALLRGMSWAVLPLVAGLFVLVAALDRTGLATALAAMLRSGEQASLADTAAGAGAVLAVVTNLMNNLPAGLIAGTMVDQAHPPRVVVDMLLIGVDLGPNLSITGSLATILWLTAIRREGENVGFWRFLKLGAVIMPPSLALAIGARLLTG